MGEIFYPGELVQVINGDLECHGWIGKVTSNQDTEGKIRVDFDEKSQGYFDATDLCRAGKKEEKEQDNPMQHFSTGAVRDVQDNKPRPDLVSPFFILRLGEHLRKGAEHYGEHNWEKGIPNSRCFASLMRHLNQWASGETNEDHLAAAAFNLMAIIHNEEVAKRNASLELLHKDLLVDMPNYFQFTKEDA